MNRLSDQTTPCRSPANCQIVFHTVDCDYCPTGLTSLNQTISILLPFGKFVNEKMSVAPLLPPKAKVGIWGCYGLVACLLSGKGGNTAVLILHGKGIAANLIGGHVRTVPQEIKVHGHGAVFDLPEEQNAEGGIGARLHHKSRTVVVKGQIDRIAAFRIGADPVADHLIFVRIQPTGGQIGRAVGGIVAVLCRSSAAWLRAVVAARL